MLRLKTIFFSSIVFIYSCTPKFDVIRKVDGDIPIAPGCVTLKDNLQIDRVEISNINYREFLYWLEKEYGYNSVEFRNAYPDTLVWREIFYDSDPYIQLYFRHPSYSRRPVIGISLQQADSFCKWRSVVVNQLLYSMDHRKTYDLLEDSVYNFPMKFVYRLPTLAEWEYAASAGDTTENSSIGFENIKDKNNNYTVYTKEISDLNKFDPWEKKFSPELPQSVYYGKPNKYGIYNMIGNVAELTGEGNIKGGSYRQYIDSCLISVNVTYSKPNAWTGFRCVCELMENDTLIKAPQFLKALNYVHELEIDTTTYPPGQDLKIDLSGYQNDFTNYYFNISATSLHSVLKMSDIFIFGQEDSILLFEIIFAPKKGNLMSDVINNDEFSVYSIDYFKHLQPGDTVVIQNFTILQAGKSVNLKPIRIKVVK